MEITEVRVFPVSEEKLKAYATITFDRCFVVRDLKVIQGNNGLFVAMPSKKRKDGTFKDTAHPLNTETREMIEAEVLAEYRRELERTGAPPPDVGDRKLETASETDDSGESGDSDDSESEPDEATDSGGENPSGESSDA
ncbi:MAG: septation regulator SpoVG [Deltaproteobacteria bacterium]|nr:septation regulator SpoVG [Deltaproteobacteria bacterium]MBW1871122.1 septation regulator SpoVG [Deltaproteobacteria bacterium]